mgnify:CR=1 FL=1
MNKKEKNRKGVMYSTNQDFEYEYENDEMETLPNNEQTLKICIDKHRSGKIAVIIKEFIGTSEDLKSLETLIKFDLFTISSPLHINCLMWLLFRNLIINSFILGSKINGSK